MHFHQRADNNENVHKLEYPTPVLGATFDQQIPKKSTEILPRPYIQLRARLSQALINHWTILLVLVILRLLFAARNLGRELDRGLVDVNVACREVQAAASTAVSMPHYLAQGTNALVKRTMEDVVASFNLVLMGIITATEALIIFFINTFKSTYICLLELAITGSLDAVLDAVETIAGYVNTTLAGISSDIALSVTEINAAINKVGDVVDDAAKLLGLHLTLPVASIPQIAELENFTIPSTFDTNLEALKSSLSLDGVQNATDAVLQIPFNHLKTLVNGTLSNYTFDQNLLTVPAQEQLSFCADGGIGHAFEGFRHVVFFSYHVILALLLIGAITIVIPSAYLEWWQWKSINIKASLAESSQVLVGNSDLVDSVLIISHPVQDSLGVKVADRFRTQKSKNLARWFISYVTHPPMLLLFLLGSAGLVACLLQVIMLTSLQRASPKISNDLGDVASLVYGKLSDSSAAWTNNTNSLILSSQDDLNTQLFSWIETSTSTVNNTLNTFTDTLMHDLNITFGGTILYTPILEVLNCILLVKIRGIENGLTWVHDQAHITLPSVPSNVLAISPADSSSMFKDAGATTSAQVQTVIDAIIKVWRATIKQEALTAGALVLAWCAFAIMALIRCFIDRQRRPTKTPFTSCFLDDVKACISRPKSMPPSFFESHSSNLSNDTLVSEAGLPVIKVTIPDVSNDDQYAVGDLNVHSLKGRLIIGSHEHKSMYGLVE